MPRTNLDKGLRELDIQMLQLGSRVKDSLTKTLKSLETGEHTSLHLVIEAGSLIDALSAATERLALRLLILQQPLGGQDMRLLTAALYIGDDLRRIGDTIVEIARSILRAASLYRETLAPGNVSGSTPYTVAMSPVDHEGNIRDAFILRGLLNLGGEVQYILEQALEAFIHRNIDSARQIGAEYDLVDLRYLPLCDAIMTMQAKTSALSTLQSDASIIQRATYLLEIANKLEQIAHYVLNICRRIIFIVEGEMDIH